MTFNDFLCEHTCRNTCNALTRALQLESEIVRLSEETLKQCDDDAIKEFITDLAENSSERILSITQKLNEIRARVDRTVQNPEAAEALKKAGHPPGSPAPDKQFVDQASRTIRQ